MPYAGRDVPFASNLVTRLCHDISGPLVAILAALELATEAAPRETADDDPLAVATDCARHLSARLTLLRAAWGMTPGPLDRAALRDLADGLPNRARLTLDLDGLGDAVVSGPAGQLLLNMLLLAGAALPKGGGIALARQGADIAAHVSGPAAAWPDGLRAALLAPDSVAPDPRTILPLLLGLQAQRIGALARLAPPHGIAGCPPGPLLLTIP